MPFWSRPTRAPAVPIATCSVANCGKQAIFATQIDLSGAVERAYILVIFSVQIVAAACPVSLGMDINAGELRNPKGCPAPGPRKIQLSITQPNSDANARSTKA